jgi:polyphenol oxidase
MIYLDKDDSGVYRIRSPFAGLRIGVVAKSASTVDYGEDPDLVRRSELALLGRITGLAGSDILSLNQLHGDFVLDADTGGRVTGPVYGDADGLITRRGGRCLVIRTADCVPIFAYDHVKKILGAVHSGWRGTRLSIARKLVREMARLGSSSCRNLQVFILPSIGPRSYTVGSDVAGLFPGDVAELDGALRLDLWRNIERSLGEEGVPAENIFNARRCTLEESGEFFSHRGGDRGRNLNFGFINPL